MDTSEVMITKKILRQGAIQKNIEFKELKVENKKLKEENEKLKEHIVHNYEDLDPNSEYKGTEDEAKAILKESEKRGRKGYAILCGLTGEGIEGLQEQVKELTDKIKVLEKESEERFMKIHNLEEENEKLALRQALRLHNTDELGVHLGRETRRRWQIHLDELNDDIENLKEENKELTDKIKVLEKEIIPPVNSFEELEFVSISGYSREDIGERFIGPVREEHSDPEKRMEKLCQLLLRRDEAELKAKAHEIAELKRIHGF
tara:strand:- start:1092 stop:1874 length:783 start_codon:yes stop_codon:yes gene_type:complete